jgi:hypothetical protein
LSNSKLFDDTFLSLFKVLETAVRDVKSERLLFDDKSKTSSINTGRLPWSSLILYSLRKQRVASLYFINFK